MRGRGIVAIRLLWKKMAFGLVQIITFVESEEIVPRINANFGQYIELSALRRTL